MSLCSLAAPGWAAAGSVTFFDDLDAIRNFAGSDYETAIVAGKAREVLIRFDERVCHYETVLEA